MAKFKVGDKIRRNIKDFDKGCLKVVGFRDKETYLCMNVPSVFGFKHPYTIEFIDKNYVKVCEEDECETIVTEEQ
jgi:hypothetical protein